MQATLDILKSQINPVLISKLGVVGKVISAGEIAIRAQFFYIGSQNVSPRAVVTTDAIISVVLEGSRLLLTLRYNTQCTPDSRLSLIRPGSVADWGFHNHEKVENICDFILKNCEKHAASWVRVASYKGMQVESLYGEVAARYYVNNNLVVPRTLSKYAKSIRAFNMDTEGDEIISSSDASNFNSLVSQLEVGMQSKMISGPPVVFSDGPISDPSKKRSRGLTRKLTDLTSQSFGSHKKTRSDPRFPNKG